MEIAFEPTARFRKGIQRIRHGGTQQAGARKTLGGGGKTQRLRSGTMGRRQSDDCPAVGNAPIRKSRRERDRLRQLLGDQR